jgi:molybdate transport system substrate-binding protein
MTSRRAVLKLVSAAALSPGAALAQAAPQVAAASDLSEALPVVAAAFTRQTGRSVRLVYGPSHIFAQHIRKGGARYEMLLAADEAYVQELDKAGLTANSGALYGVGRLCLFLHEGARLGDEPRLEALGPAVRDGRLERVALFSPDGAYGRATREALTRAGVWMALQPRVAFAENASQMVQLITAGGAQAGVIPLTVALRARVQAAGDYSIVPQSYHRPLRQRAVLLKGASPTAESFYRFLRSPQARAVMRRHGFNLPAGR